MANEESSRSHRLFVLSFYVGGAVLLAFVVVDGSLSYPLLVRTPEVLRVSVLYYLWFWALIVPITLWYKGLASVNKWVRRSSIVVALSLILFVLERDYHAWALSNQLAEIIDGGLPEKLEIRPTRDEIITVDAQSFMCGQGTVRELSWLSEWTGQVFTICVDTTSRRAWQAGTWSVHGRWMLAQQFLHVWTVVVVIIAVVKLVRRITTSYQARATKEGHAQLGDRADGTLPSGDEWAG